MTSEPDPMCPSCRRSLYAVLHQVGRHYGCRTPGPLDAESFGRMAAYLAVVLGDASTSGAATCVAARQPVTEKEHRP